MVVTYTKKELARIFNVSPRTIEDDARHLGIKPEIGDRNINLYSQKDYDLIEQLRKHCNNGNNSRDSFIQTSKVEIIEDEAKVSLIKKANPQIIKYQESLDASLYEDPLFDLQLLQRISDHKWLLPANRLAPLFGVTPKYLNSKKTYEYCGFVANKEVYVNNKVLWKVEANNN